MRTNIQMMRYPYMDKLKEDKAAEYDKNVYKQTPMLAVALCVALPITFFILLYITDELIAINQLIQ